MSQDIKKKLTVVVIHPKNIIKPNNQMATTSLLVCRFYLGEEVFQAELWQALAKGNYWS
jgi:hypothetical protein